ncbi:flavodoxin family protein [Chloroflexota bacterium]
MKVVGIVGSHRINGNTEFLTRYTLDAIGEEGIDAELIRLSGLDLSPCRGCGHCHTQESCAIDDGLYEIYLKMKAADGIILASPVYYGSATALIKALMERTGNIARWNGNVFAGKSGGPLAVARRAGVNLAIAQLTLWFQIQSCFVAGSTYWNVAFGGERGEVSNDDEGLKTARNFGKNLAFLMQKLAK